MIKQFDVDRDGVISRMKGGTLALVVGTDLIIQKRRLNLRLCTKICGLLLDFIQYDNRSEKFDFEIYKNGAKSASGRDRGCGLDCL